MIFRYFSASFGARYLVETSVDFWKIQPKCGTNYPKFSIGNVLVSNNDFETQVRRNNCGTTLRKFG